MQYERTSSSSIDRCVNIRCLLFHVCLIDICIHVPAIFHIRVFFFHVCANVYNITWRLRIHIQDGLKWGSNLNTFSKLYRCTIVEMGNEWFITIISWQLILCNQNRISFVCRRGRLSINYTIIMVIYSYNGGVCSYILIHHFPKFSMLQRLDEISDTLKIGRLYSRSS